MAIALQTTYLSSDLASPKEYQAGSVLQLTLNFTTPQDGNYYLLGALFTNDLDYIDGTLFGILVAEGVDYAVNDPQQTSLWQLVADESAELGCRFTFDQSDIVLGLFLVKMAGEAPSLADDEEIGSLSAQLVSPAAGLDLSAMLAAAIAVMMMGVVMTTTMKD